MTLAEHPLRIVVFGLSITSSWGNGHATTYRSIVKGLVARGHEVTFYERRQPWYEANQDLPQSNLCEVMLYDSVADLDDLCGIATMAADLVIVGSYVPDGIRVAEWVQRHALGTTAFYDIDTPVTLAQLEKGSCAYLAAESIPSFDLYLTFSGGPQLIETLETRYGARKVIPFYCSVDTEQYFPHQTGKRYDLGYLGTYSPDRQPKLEALLNAPARQWPDGRFCVAGAQYPDEIEWPGNVVRIDHVPPTDHARFYNSQQFTLNLTRQDMVAQGHSPSVRLFEAAACGIPVISDSWRGLEEFFIPGREILIAETPDDVMRILHDVSARDAQTMGLLARRRILVQHTSEHRAVELEHHVASTLRPRRRKLTLLDQPRRPSGATLH